MVESLCVGGVFEGSEVSKNTGYAMRLCPDESGLVGGHTHLGTRGTVVLFYAGLARRARFVVAHLKAVAVSSQAEGIGPRWARFTAEL